MSEMVERVALAYETERKLWTQKFTAIANGIQVEMCRDGRAIGSPWSLHVFEVSGWRAWQSLRDEASARAAIAAMREPTEEMARAMAEACMTREEARNKHLMAMVDYKTIAASWRGGIDAALKAAPSTPAPRE
jgi:hypothetical protein